MSPEKKIRLQAKNSLANNWTMAVAVILVVFAAFIVMIYLLSSLDLLCEALFDKIKLDQIFDTETYTEGYFTNLLILPGTILLIPLVMGALRFFYLISKNTDVRFSEVFYYTGKKYFKSLGVFFGVGVRCLWQAIVCFLPSYTGFILLTNATAEKDKLAFSDKLCYFIVYALIFGGILLFARLCVKYFLSFFLFFEDESLSINELCTLSVSYMERFKGSVMKLILSLFPPILSCILIIPCLFVLPFVFTCLSTSAKWIIALHYQSENKDE